MSLELSGTIVTVYDTVTGEGKNGPWKRREFVMSYKDGDYDKNVCFTLFGDKVSKLDNILEGEKVLVKFNVESREHSNRWYTNLSAWFVKAEDSEPRSDGDSEPSDDLPF